MWARTLLEWEILRERWRRICWTPSRQTESWAADWHQLDRWRWWTFEQSQTAPRSVHQNQTRCQHHLTSTRHNQSINQSKQIYIANQRHIVKEIGWVFTVTVGSESKSSVVKLRLKVLDSSAERQLCDSEFQTAAALTMKALKCHPRYRQ